MSGRGSNGRPSSLIPGRWPVLQRPSTGSAAGILAAKHRGRVNRSSADAKRGAHGGGVRRDPLAVRTFVEIGVAAIPLSAFYADGFEQRIARLCFAKRDETLHSALSRLARL